MSIDNDTRPATSLLVVVRPNRVMQYAKSRFHVRMHSTSFLDHASSFWEGAVDCSSSCLSLSISQNGR